MNKISMVGVWLVAVNTVCIGIRTMLPYPSLKPQPQSLNVTLVDAVDHSDARSVAELLSKGASPNAENEYGWPILLLATENQRTEIVKLLLDSGANINATNQHGDTALMRASGNVPILRLLLDRGADVEPRNVVGQTALIYAAMCNRGADGVALLLSHNAPIAITDNEGRSAIWYARHNGWKDNERLLREKSKA